MQTFWCNKIYLSSLTGSVISRIFFISKNSRLKVFSVIDTLSSLWPSSNVLLSRSHSHKLLLESETVMSIIRLLFRRRLKMQLSKSLSRNDMDVAANWISNVVFVFRTKLNFFVPVSSYSRKKKIFRLVSASICSTGLRSAVNAWPQRQEETSQTPEDCS